MIIKYFSWVKDLAETAEEIIELPENVNNVDELINHLIEKNKKYEKVFSKKGEVKIAVNKIYADAKTQVKNEDEIAFFPPVTGG